LGLRNRKKKKICLGFTHRKLFLLKVTHAKFQKLQSYPQQVVFVLMLPAQQRLASKLCTENRNCLSLPTKVGFFEKVPTKE